MRDHAQAVSPLPQAVNPLPEPDAPAPSAPSTGLRLLQNTIAVLIGRGVGIFCAGAASVLLTRFLGVERSGEYAAIYAYLTLFTWLASFGVGPLVAREASKDRNAAGSLVATGIRIAAAFAILTGAIALACAPVAHLGGKLFSLLAIAAIEVLLLGPISLPGIIFQVDLRQWYPSAFSIVRQTLWLGVVLVLIWAGVPLVYVILGRLAVASVEAGLNWHFGHRFLQGPRKYLSPVARKLLSGGFVVTLTILATNIYMRIDQVMLHRMVGDTALGQYAPAVRVSELFEALPAAFISSLFPLLCASLADPARYRRFLDLGFRYMTLAGAGLSLTVCLGARPIIHFLYGARFAPAAPLLAVLIWSEIAIFFSGTLSNALFAEGLQRFVLITTVVGAMINVVLNLVLIPRWGAMGASWATVIAYGLSWTAAFLPFRATRGTLWVGLRLLAPIVTVALLVYAGAFLLPVNDWARLGLASVVFVLLSLVFKFVRKQDFEFLRNLWRSRLDARAGEAQS
jgi:O-antigen/teichoic acid export membrane protein